jgi:hypothetical protein
MSRFKPIQFLPFFIVILAYISPVRAEVKYLETPGGGIQPKVAIDGNGTTHLIYYKGKANAGNLYDTWKSKGGNWSAPMVVNSTKDSAISMGTIRGAQFAFAQDGRIHVVWNGSAVGLTKGAAGPPMWYARSNPEGKGFEIQQPVSGNSPVDGGGTVVVDRKGIIHVFWHSGKHGGNEQDRRIFVRSSWDSGRSFSPEKAISPPNLGVCGCCSIQAGADSQNNLYVIFRTADAKGNRDICLLVSGDGGSSFDHGVADEWKVAACPMSSMSILETPEAMVAGWETGKNVKLGIFPKGSAQCDRVIPIDSPAPMKHPVLARAPDGQILAVWTEGTGWNKGGGIGCQLFDASLRPISKITRIPGSVPTWSFAAVYYDQEDRNFYIVQ